MLGIIANKNSTCCFISLRPVTTTPFFSSHPLKRPHPPSQNLPRSSSLFLTTSFNSSQKSTRRGVRAMVQSSSKREKISASACSRYPAAGMYVDSSGPVLIGSHTGLKGRKYKQEGHSFTSLQKSQLLNFFGSKPIANNKRHKQELQELKRKIVLGLRLPCNQADGQKVSGNLIGAGKPSKLVLKEKENQQMSSICKEGGSVYARLKTNYNGSETNPHISIPHQNIRPFRAQNQSKLTQKKQQTSSRHSQQQGSPWSMNQSLAFQSIRIVAPSTDDLTAQQSPTSILSISLHRSGSQGISKSNSTRNPNEEVAKLEAAVPGAAEQEGKQSLLRSEQMLSQSGVTENPNGQDRVEKVRKAHGQHCLQSSRISDSHHLHQSPVLVGTQIPFSDAPLSPSTHALPIEQPSERPQQLFSQQHPEIISSYSPIQPINPASIGQDYGAKAYWGQRQKANYNFFEQSQDPNEKEGIRETLLESIPMIRTLESRKGIVEEQFHGSNRVCIRDFSVLMSDLGCSKESFSMETRNESRMKKKDWDC